MIVGILELTLAIPAQSLKEKRGIVRKIIHRARNKFNVTAAEVDKLDYHQATTLGFAAVSNDEIYTQNQLRKLIEFIDQLYLGEIIDDNIIIERY